jgi:hypothetical protein
MYYRTSSLPPAQKLSPAVAPLYMKRSAGRPAHASFLAVFLANLLYTYARVSSRTVRSRLNMIHYERVTRVEWSSLRHRPAEQAGPLFKF